MSDYKNYLSIERNWIECHLTDHSDSSMPPEGEMVDVKTIFGFEDVGIWDGTRWTDDRGKWRGDRKEVSAWRFIRK